MGRAAKGGGGKPSLDVIKGSYRNARDNGDKEEEARWANEIGHAFNNRGQYVTALKWFRKDYEISSSGAIDPVKLMPTCQSIGEVYLRLKNYDDALTYQHKHFHWAEQAGDLVEQQRASTQLGRTYLELYEVKDRLSALPDAKAYFQTSLELARRLRTNLPADDTSPSGFVIEQVDAYNNLGLVRTLAEDYKQALKFYTAGLKLCDEEEVGEHDAARSRIHHNLGRLYCDLRSWEEAKYHTELDIEICQKIPHAQGEAKGLMNLAELYFKSQDYEQTIRCSKRALHIAQTLEDEDTLCFEIKSNFEIVEQAKAKSKTFDAGMRKLSKLRRDVESSKGTPAERKYIKQECALLLDLSGLAEELQSWEVHLGLAKRLKSLRTGLGDIEKLGDALELVASSYYSLRKFQKAMKWHLKSFELCKRIGHLEGQVVAKINYGNALDASGDSETALDAYQHAFETAKTGGVKMIPQQISALENIHYCYFVRLERLEDARKVERQLKQLKYTRGAPEDKDEDSGDDRCSETGSEGPSEGRAIPEESFCLSDQNSSLDGISERGKASEVLSRKSKVVADSEESDDDSAPLASIKPQIRNRRLSQRISIAPHSKNSKSIPDIQLHGQDEHSAQGNELSGGANARNLLSRDHRKRVLSDDESGEDGSMEMELGRREASKSTRESRVVKDIGIATRSGDKGAVGSKRKVGSCSARHNDAAENHVTLSSEDDDGDLPTFSRKRRKLSNNNASSRKSSCSTDNLGSPLDDVEVAPPGGTNGLASASHSHLKFRNVNIPELGSKDSEGRPRGKSTEAGGSQAKKTSGPKDEESFGRATTRISSPAADEGAAPSLTTGYSGHLNDPELPRTLSNSSQGWTNTSLLEFYLNHCSTAIKYISPNSLLVEKLRFQKVSEEVVVAGCNLQDSDARPLLAALRESDAFSLLDMSHNLLGNATVHAIQELIKSTDQADLGLTLDLHCNKLGAGALLEICRCPVSLSRLEVLNLSGNRLTDAAARHLSKILKESQALATLNLESCALTTRAIAQLTSALHPESRLNKLCIGNNTPIASHAIQELLQQLSTLLWFSHLDLKGLELDGAAVACLCTFLGKSKRITTLILQNTEILNDGAFAIANALSNPSHCLENLDLSLNGFNNGPAATLCKRVMSLQRLSDLNLSGNNLSGKAAEALANGLARTDCRLKALDLSKCHLGPSGVLLIMQSLGGQTTLVDLNLADNIRREQLQLPPRDDSTLPCPRAKVGEGQAENPSLLQLSPKKVTLLEHIVGLSQNSESEPARHLSAELVGERRPAAGVAGESAGEQLAGELTGGLAGGVAGEQLAGELTRDHSGTRATDVRLGAQQNGQGTEGSVSSLTAQSIPSPTNFRDVNPEATHKGTNGSDSIQLEVTLGLSQSEAAGAKEMPTAAFCGEGVLKFEPHDNSSRKKNSEPLQQPQQLLEVDSTDLKPKASSAQETTKLAQLEKEGVLKFERHDNSSRKKNSEPVKPPHLLEVYSTDLKPKASSAQETTKLAKLEIRPTTICGWGTTVAHVFCKQLSISIRNAKGLQRLNLSHNSVAGSDIDTLYLAWSASPRGGISDHVQHVDSTVIHFSVKGRPCPCADSPCCASQ